MVEGKDINICHVSDIDQKYNATSEDSWTDKLMSWTGNLYESDDCGEKEICCK